MEFKNQYLKKDEFLELGGKDSMTSSAFNLLEYDAEKEIDELTSSRFRKLSEEEYPQELKMCVYKLMEFLKKANSSIISGETVGNYSITKKTDKEIKQEKESIIKKYLSDTKVNGIFVLYRGVDMNGD